MTKTENNRYLSLFLAQKENQFSVANTTPNQRIKKLKALRKALEYTYRDQLKDAIVKDLKRHPSEADLVDIYPTISEIKVAVKHLRQWMSKHRVSTPLFLIGSKSSYRYEPKGVCLIISPFNFPLLLTFAPLVSAIAAGNTVILKPTEATKHTAAVMEQIVNDLFDANEVAMVRGTSAETTELLKLPFNHIFFTGSPRVGKIVMKAAAENLASVTLELGGKNPLIIDETANLKAAAKRIAWGKLFNNGQACVAPDYIFIHETAKEKFIKLLKEQVKVYYGSDASKSPSFSRVINTKSFERLKKHIIDAKDKGATIEAGGGFNAEDNYIEPTIISDLPEEASILQDEIFGPIITIMTYSKKEDVINYINPKEKPLAFYVYSKSRKNIEYFINNSRAGSTAINNNIVQFGNHYLPFGGSNNSGIGKSHGYFGFQEFSNMRSVLRQYTPGSVELVFPPYTDFKQKLIDLTIKWF
ncbi:UNVERIFIED_CONTAM: hypothetical protein GTU68_020299 [Idotea baltica]|nr:hypothetical protein [Idotea baltica]